MSSVLERINQLGLKLGLRWFDYQLETFQGWNDQADSKACLYFKTGAGKSITSLVMMHMRGVKECVVVAPPSTHASWAKVADELGIGLTTISHAKFRMKDYKLSRTKAIIVDEFHMLGGHGGKGWKKLDTLARHLQAPLIICSATPSYNDAERVYCIKHVLEPNQTKGGYLEFLFRDCTVEHDPFSATPKVIGFQRHADAASYLASLAGVYYLADDLVYQIIDIDLQHPLPDEFERYSYDGRNHKIMASGMAQRHTATFQRYVNEHDLLHTKLLDEVLALIAQAQGPVLVFANHATIALATLGSIRHYINGIGFVSGGMSTKAKAEELARFKGGQFNVLIGTAALATGTDGLDKVCDTLIILDDTEDDSFRRQLVGRIMPRGSDTDMSKKRVYRIVVS